MKSEKLLEAMGGIDEELVSAALEQPGKRVRRPKITWARVAIAACLCLVLALPVAAVVSGLWIHFYPEESRWEADVPISLRMPVSAFSQQVRDLSAQLGTEAGHYVMADMAEAEEFLGVPLPDNPLLNGARQKTLHYEFPNGETMSGPCLVRIGNNVDGILMAVHTEAHYIYQGVHVELWCAIPTDLNPYENGGGISMYYGDNGDPTAPVPGEDPDTEEYVTPSGLTCTLVLLDVDYGYNGYAYVLVDNVMAEIIVRGDDEGQVRSILTQLLDAYG